MHDKNNGFKQKAAAFFEKNGFYVVLMLCLAVVGATAFFTFAHSGKEEPEQETPVEVRQTTDESLESAISIPSPTPQATMTAEILPSPSPAPAATPAPKQKSSAKTSKTLYEAPVQGTVILPFADETLVYSRTLNQWTSHPGIDIQAEEGTGVKSIAKGVVEKAVEDPQMGYCVVISHNGVKSTYANLKELPALKSGDSVKKGDVIGQVGKSAINECEDEPHLHFELRMDDKLVDPKDYLIGVTKLEDVK